MENEFVGVDLVGFRRPDAEAGLRQNPHRLIVAGGESEVIVLDAPEPLAEHFAKDRRNIDDGVLEEFLGDEHRLGVVLVSVPIDVREVRVGAQSGPAHWRGDGRARTEPNPLVSQASGELRPKVGFSGVAARSNAAWMC